MPGLVVAAGVDAGGAPLLAAAAHAGAGQVGHPQVGEGEDAAVAGQGAAPRCLLLAQVRGVAVLPAVVSQGQLVHAGGAPRAGRVLVRAVVVRLPVVVEGVDAGVPAIVPVPAVGPGGVVLVAVHAGGAPGVLLAGALLVVHPAVHHGHAALPGDRGARPEVGGGSAQRLLLCVTVLPGVVVSAGVGGGGAPARAVRVRAGVVPHAVAAVRRLEGEVALVPGGVPVSAVRPVHVVVAAVHAGGAPGRAVVSAGVDQLPVVHEGDAGLAGDGGGAGLAHNLHLGRGPVRLLAVLPARVGVVQVGGGGAPAAGTLLRAVGVPLPVVVHLDTFVLVWVAVPTIIPVCQAVILIHLRSTEPISIVAGALVVRMTLVDVPGYTGVPLHCGAGPVGLVTSHSASAQLVVVLEGAPPVGVVGLGLLLDGGGAPGVTLGHAAVVVGDAVVDHGEGALVLVHVAVAAVLPGGVGAAVRHAGGAPGVVRAPGVGALHHLDPALDHGHALLPGHGVARPLGHLGVAQGRGLLLATVLVGVVVVAVIDVKLLDAGGAPTTAAGVGTSCVIYVVVFEWEDTRGIVPIDTVSVAAVSVALVAAVIIGFCGAPAAGRLLGAARVVNIVVDHGHAVLAGDGGAGAVGDRAPAQRLLRLVAVLVGVVRPLVLVHAGGAPAAAVGGGAGRVLGAVVHEGEGALVAGAVPVAAVAVGLVGAVLVGAGGAPLVRAVSAALVVDAAVGHGHTLLAGHREVLAAGAVQRVVVQLLRQHVCPVQVVPGPAALGGVRLEGVSVHAGGAPPVLRVLGAGVELPAAVAEGEGTLVPGHRVAEAAVGPGGVGAVRVGAGGAPGLGLDGAGALVADASIGEVHAVLPSHRGAALVPAAGLAQVVRGHPVLRARAVPVVVVAAGVAVGGGGAPAVGGQLRAVEHGAAAVLHRHAVPPVIDPAVAVRLVVAACSQTCKRCLTLFDKFIQNSDKVIRLVCSPCI